MNRLEEARVALEFLDQFEKLKTILWKRYFDEFNEILYHIEDELTLDLSDNQDMPF